MTKKRGRPKGVGRPVGSGLAQGVWQLHILRSLLVAIDKDAACIKLVPDSATKSEMVCICRAGKRLAELGLIHYFKARDTDNRLRTFVAIKGIPEIDEWVETVRLEPITLDDVPAGIQSTYFPGSRRMRKLVAKAERFERWADEYVHGELSTD